LVLIEPIFSPHRLSIKIRPMATKGVTTTVRADIPHRLFEYAIFRCRQLGRDSFILISRLSWNE
jgi:hypothetical protein